VPIREVYFTIEHGFGIRGIKRCHVAVPENTWGSYI